MMQTSRIKSDSQPVWLIDAAHSTVEFTVKNFAVFTVRGRFEEISGQLSLNDDVTRASVEVAIEAESIVTGIKRRDAHLRSKDFLAVDSYPEIRFKSTKVERGRDRDTLRVAGVLTIRETSREVVLNVDEVDHSTSPRGEDVVYYAVTTELDRFEFGVKHLPGVIGRKVGVVLNIQATRRPDSAIADI